MTREEILKMAESVGFYLLDFIDQDGSITEQIESNSSESIYRFAALVAAAEREECAKVCESIAEDFACDPHNPDPVICADAIRARGNT